MIVKVTIPITNYEGTGIFEQPVYFDASPTKEQMLQELYNRHVADSKYPEYTGDWQNCIEITKAVSDQDWRFVNSRLLATNCHVKHPKFGDVPYSWQVISVTEIAK
jgi:hypothetical protein